MNNKRIAKELLRLAKGIQGGELNQLMNEVTQAVKDSRNDGIDGWFKHRDSINDLLKLNTANPRLWKIFDEINDEVTEIIYQKALVNRLVFDLYKQVKREL